jgi:hypothetical protein
MWIRDSYWFWDCLFVAAWKLVKVLYYASNHFEARSNIFSTRVCLVLSGWEVIQSPRNPLSLHWASLSLLQHSMKSWSASLVWFVTTTHQHRLWISSEPSKWVQDRGPQWQKVYPNTPQHSFGIGLAWRFEKVWKGQCGKTCASVGVLNVPLTLTCKYLYNSLSWPSSVCTGQLDPAFIFFAVCKKHRKPQDVGTRKAPPQL